MENLSLGGVDFNESMFNSQIEQQHSHPASHFKHQQFVSNLFKRNIEGRSSKEQDFKEADIKPYSYLSHAGNEMGKESISHTDDIDHNDMSGHDGDAGGYDESMKSRSHLIGENLSMNGKKSVEDSHYCRMSQ